MLTLENATPPSADEPADKSLLTRLIEEIQRDSGLNLSFEDLTGITHDIPGVCLPYRLRIHTCNFCMYAKHSPESHQHCVRNKMAANRVALRRPEGYSGLCHLGMTELVRPVVCRDQVLGIFYFGTFVSPSAEEKARERIVKFCQRHGFDPKGYLLAFDHAPRVPDERIPELWRRLNLVVDLTNAIVENSGLPINRYRTRSGAQFATWQGAMPALVRKVIVFINHNYGSSLRVSDIAEIHHCNPDYLGRVFRRTVGLKLNEYIQRVRIDHAQRLLLANRFSIGEVGFMVGFQDHSHFGKIFRSVVGVTPQDYRSDSERTASNIESNSFSTFEYSNVHSFNPQFGGKPTGRGRLIM